MLLLSATPLEDDTHGFFRLLQVLRPDEFPEGLDIMARLESGEPFPPCTSSTRRLDIGGLPPRVPVAVDVDLVAVAPDGQGPDRARIDLVGLALDLDAAVPLAPRSFTKVAKANGTPRRGRSPP